MNQGLSVGLVALSYLVEEGERSSGSNHSITESVTKAQGSALSPRTPRSRKVLARASHPFQLHRVFPWVVMAPGGNWAACQSLLCHS